MCSDTGRVMCDRAWLLLAMAGTGVAIAIAMATGKLGTAGFFRKSAQADDSDSNTEGEDRISGLPDDILGNILSRLCLSEAIKTSILSRRWRNCRASISQLNLCCYSISGALHPHPNRSHSKQRFLTALDQIFRHFLGRKIPHVHFRCCFMNEFPSVFERWVHCIACLGVERLRLDFQRHISNKTKCVSFPLSFPLLSKVASLKYLDLWCCELQPSFQGRFGSLVLLKLLMVPLDNVVVSSILSSCPNLQTLKILLCKLPRKLVIFGDQHLRLKVLMIGSCDRGEEIQLSAPNLASFHVVSYGRMRFVLSCVPKLEEISARLNGAGSMPYLVGEIANNCSQLKSFLLHTDTNEVQLPLFSMFSHLRHLDLLVKSGARTDLFDFTPILLSCPNLEKLHIVAKCSSSNDERRNIWPASLYACLKEVVFGEFRGTRSEIEFLSYLLRTAPVLELMLLQSLISIISRSTMIKGVNARIDKERRESIYDQLLGQVVSQRLSLQIEWEKCRSVFINKSSSI